ncbi:conserved protein of unknown function [Burkholderia multivorans]
MYEVALDGNLHKGHIFARMNPVASPAAGAPMPLTNAVKSLLDKPHRVESTSAIIESLSVIQKVVEAQLLKLKDRHCPQTMLDIHYALFLLQQVHFAEASDHRAFFQFDPVVVWLRERLQDWWIEREEAQLSPPILSQDVFIGDLKKVCLEHPGAQHPLFDFLEQEATPAQLVAFFESDAQLNTRFFDLLAFCLVGTHGTAKAELAQNLWDEAGRGDPQAAHVAMFEEILAGHAVSAQWRDGLSLAWEGLAGHNLFVALCVGRKHQYKALGLMAATELIDPASYTKLLAGCRRLGMSMPAYYSEHVEIDIVHGDGWLDNVIAPIIQRAPHLRTEITLGAMLRMSSCRSYYDQVLHTLRTVTA